MNKMTIILISIVAVIVIILLAGIGGYNNLVSLQESVDNQYANLDTMLQRRADLIPNLVNTVKGFTSHEDEIIGKVTDARAKLVGANTLEEKSEANDELTNSLNALMVVVENYPDLKSSENFINLQDELAGTENRIATARKDYNDAVNKLNTKIKKFPSNIMAGMFGIEKAKYFEATEKSTEVPNVSFE